MVQKWEALISNETQYIPCGFLSVEEEEFIEADNSNFPDDNTMCFSVFLTVRDPIIPGYDRKG